MSAAAATFLPSAEDGQREFVFGDREFRRIAAIVHDQTGIVLGSHKKTMAYSRLVRRLRALGLESFKEYCHYLETDEGTGEVGALINAITTNLTKFFREAHHFDHLRDVAIPQSLAAREGNRRLRLWSAGCSTGEEPYSIAMVLAGHAPRLSGWDAKILATDLDTAVLQTASQGVYNEAQVENVPQNYRRHYMQEIEAGQSWQVDPRLRSMIHFNRLNLLGDWPLKADYDVIFCRNVMIYFDNPAKKRLVERLADKLRPGGWLYIGHSETLLDQHANLRLAGRTIYQKVADAP